MRLEVRREAIWTYPSFPPTHVVGSSPQLVSLILAMVYPVLSRMNVMRDRPYVLGLVTQSLDSSMVINRVVGLVSDCQPSISLWQGYKEDIRF